MSTEFEKEKKIRPGKLTLSLVVYIIGVPIATIIMAVILSFILNIPFIRAILNFLISISRDLMGDLRVIAIPMLIANYIAYKVSELINGSNYKTHGMATFIYGIIFIVCEVIFLIMNIILGGAIGINVIGIIVGACLIGLGRKEL